MHWTLKGNSGEAKEDEEHGSDKPGWKAGMVVRGRVESRKVKEEKTLKATLALLSSFSHSTNKWLTWRYIST